MTLSAQQALDIQLVERQWPIPADGSIYLNTGSCGRKPVSVLEKHKAHLESSNLNPTISTFIDSLPWQNARLKAAAFFHVEPTSLLLTNSTSQAMQLIMQSFLLNKGDEVVTTTHEHGSTRAILRFLEESRGIKIRYHNLNAFDGSQVFNEAILGLVNRNTKLVVVSEIDCASGWRPKLDGLCESLRANSIPLLVDGAHAPAHGICRPGKYQLWAGSGHKWLCGPNGTGFAYVAPDLVPFLKPFWLSDRFYQGDKNDLLRFEYQGTTDAARLAGLSEAIDLQERLDVNLTIKRQKELVAYLRGKLNELAHNKRPVIKTPDWEEESTGMVTLVWPAKLVPVPDLRQTLWDNYKIWIQPDFFHGEPGHGIRVSCHIANRQTDLDKLVEALWNIFK